jgi:hypothetical protein
MNPTLALFLNASLASEERHIARFKRLSLIRKESIFKLRGEKDEGLQINFLDEASTIFDMESVQYSSIHCVCHILVSHLLIFHFHTIFF